MRSNRTLLLAVVCAFGAWTVLAQTGLAHSSARGPAIVPTQAVKAPVKKLTVDEVLAGPATVKPETVPCAVTFRVAAAKPAQVKAAPCAAKVKPTPCATKVKPAQLKAVPCDCAKKLEKACNKPCAAYGVPSRIEAKHKPAVHKVRRREKGDGGEAPVPEPATMILLGLAGTAGVLARRIRKDAKKFDV